MSSLRLALKLSMAESNPSDGKKSKKKSPPGSIGAYEPDLEAILGNHSE